MKISDALKDFAIIFIFILVIVAMFIMHYAVSNVGKVFNEKIISNEITGGVIEIPGQPQPPPVIITQPPQPRNPVVIINNQ